MNYMFIRDVITFLATVVFNSRLTGYLGTEQRAVAPGPPLPLALLQRASAELRAGSLLPLSPSPPRSQRHFKVTFRHLPCPRSRSESTANASPWLPRSHMPAPISTWSAHRPLLHTAFRLGASASAAPAAWVASLRCLPAGSLSVISVLNISATIPGSPRRPPETVASSPPGMQGGLLKNLSDPWGMTKFSFLQRTARSP